MKTFRRRVLLAMFLSIVCLRAYSYNQHNDVQIFALINEDRSSIDLNLKSVGLKDQFCDKLSLEISYTRAEFNEPLAKSKLDVANLYVTANVINNYPDLGKQLSSEIQKEVPDAQIQGVNFTVGNCVEASFTHYCEYSRQSEEDIKTIDALMDLYGTDSCSRVERRVRAKVDLSKRDISSLKPITFFPQIRDLILSYNRIEDVKDLQKLPKLKNLDLSYNPIEQVEAFYLMQGLRYLDLSGTSVYKQEFQWPKSLKKVYLKDTPYSKGVEKPNVTPEDTTITMTGLNPNQVLSLTDALRKKCGLDITESLESAIPTCLKVNSIKVDLLLEKEDAILRTISKLKLK